MLVDVEKVIDFCGVDSKEDSLIVTDIHKSVESWIDSYCNKTLLTTPHAEYYDGNGNQFLQLDHYPITGLTRIAVGRRTAIRVQNTGDCASATVSVTATGIILTKDGTSSTSSALTFATSTGMSTLVSAITGDGWFAVLNNSEYSNYNSSELVQMFGKSAIKDNWVYLDMPEEALNDFEVYPNRGEIYRCSGWDEGHNNVYVEYVAGYATTPADLELAVEMFVKYIYQKRDEDTFGIKAYSLGDISTTFENGGDVPNEIKLILNKYRRILI